MKIKFILATLAAVVLASCAKNTVDGDLSEFKVNTSYISLPEKGGQVSIKLTATVDWFIDTTDVDWMKVNPANGGAGEFDVVFSADSTAETHTATLLIYNADKSKKQYLYVTQQAGAPVVEQVTCADVIAGPNNKTYRVKGTVVGPIKNDYGNWYIKDETGQVYVYGTLNKEGQNYKAAGTNVLNNNDSKSWTLNVGDVALIEGPKSTYGTTIELVDVTILQIIPSLLDVVTKDSTFVKEGGEFIVKAIKKGDNLVVKSYPDWVTLKSVDFKNAPDTSVVVFNVNANEDDSREGDIVLVSAQGEQSTEISVKVSQKSGLSAYPLPYEETFSSSIGAWKDSVVVMTSPMTYVWKWAGANYGMKAMANISKVNYPSEGHLISPLIDLSTATAASLSFDHVWKFAANVYTELTLQVSKDNGNSWNSILIPEYSTGKDWNFITTSVSLTPYVGNMIQIRFVYKSSSAAAATWEIKNVKVTGEEVVIKNLAQLASFATPTERPFTAEFDSTIVTYINGYNAFLQDKTGGVQIYKKNTPHGLVATDVLKGTVTGNVKLYNGFAEITSINTTSATKSTATVVADTLSFANLDAAYQRYVNCRVVCKDVTLGDNLSSAKKDAVFSSGSVSINARLQNSSITINAGTGTMTGYPSLYNAVRQIGMWEATDFVVKPQ